MIKRDFSLAHPDPDDESGSMQDMFAYFCKGKTTKTDNHEVESECDCRKKPVNLCLGSTCQS